MSPRPKKHTGLPRNLTFDRSRGLYRYTHPVTKRRIYLSADRRESIDTADEANAHYARADAGLLRRITGGETGTGRTFSAAIDRFISERLPDLRLADKTLSDYRGYFAALRRSRLGPMKMRDIEVLHVADMLDEITAGRRMRNVYRSMASKIFAFAVQIGWANENIAEKTLRVKTDRERSRMTMAGFEAICAAAEPWLERAMRLALITLQRREDLCVMRFDHIEGGVLKVDQIKTGVRLGIRTDGELASLLDEIRRDGLVCPFIVRRRPCRSPSPDRTSKNARTHTFQVLPDRLTRAVAEARDASGFYARDPNPPTLHEIRSLGAHRYRDAGWDEKAIQALLGHSDVKTTRIYLGGHKPPRKDVSSGVRSPK